MKKKYFAPKRGVRGVISQKERLKMLRDVHQIEAFRTPDHVELTERRNSWQLILTFYRTVRDNFRNVKAGHAT